MRCRHPGFVSQTYRIRPGRVTVLPAGITLPPDAYKPGTYWSLPRCARCGALERPLTPPSAGSGPRVGLWLAAGIWAGGLALIAARVMGWA